MDQIKTGNLIRDLRKEKNLTQEQLAEEFGVSRRTVSRWETGSNMPDLDILIDMSDFYDVDLRELLDGERKEDKMNKELEETVVKVAEYSNKEQERKSKMVLGYFIAGLLGMVINVAMDIIEYESTFWMGFIKGSTAGLAMGAMALGILFITGNLSKICNEKKRIVKRQMEK